MFLQSDVSSSDHHKHVLGLHLEYGGNHTNCPPLRGPKICASTCKHIWQTDRQTCDALAEKGDADCDKSASSSLIVRQDRYNRERLQLSRPEGNHG